ncbi:carbohydrate ABC transporter permease [Hydrogenoanaerobacterium sp.]|uniref:carbohydrate ABC transporter permease n=1 Tax=Hydrogenoanaerobacterium sp. TaxID=2953763 RepID=UPI00289ABB04|nr:carbohydrate ABC transporter permease [Hydrogenoanaerobacterium sp.]
MFQKTIGFRIFLTLSILLIGGFVFLPLLWLINTALKPAAETFTLSFFTGPMTLDNFKNVITDMRILTYLKNSLVVSFLSSFMATLVSALAGYSFSKFRYRGRSSIMTVFMLAQAFPQAILLLSIYMMMMKMGMLDNYWSLVLSYVVFTLPVGTWTMKSYFDQLPNALIESAKVDGAGHMRTMAQIIFPLAVPGMVSIAIYGFVWSWNDLLYSLTLVTDPGKRTLAPGLVLTYLGEFQNNWANMMAAAVVVSIPVTIIFIFLQRYFIQGLTAGAVKG